MDGCEWVEMWEMRNEGLYCITGMCDMVSISSWMRGNFTKSGDCRKKNWYDLKGCEIRRRSGLYNVTGNGPIQDVYQVLLEKTQTRCCWNMMWSDPCATQQIFFSVIWLPAHTVYILSAGIISSVLFIPPFVCSLCGPLVKKLPRVLVPSVCSRPGFGTCSKQLL